MHQVTPTMMYQQSLYAKDPWQKGEWNTVEAKTGFVEEKNRMKCSGCSVFICYELFIWKENSFDGLYMLYLITFHFSWKAFWKCSKSSSSKEDFSPYVLQVSYIFSFLVKWI